MDKKINIHLDLLSDLPPRSYSNDKTVMKMNLS